MANPKAYGDQILADIHTKGTIYALESLKAEVLGKKGQLTQWMKEIAVLAYLQSLR